ncbi:MAG: SDR family oxidoreductase [Hyphomicrobiaceae bacterium]
MRDVQSAPVVLVTGSSSGIGQACAARLHGHGWSVFGGRRTTSNKQYDWPSVRLDVTDEDTIRQAIARVTDGRGRLDALVHCAGISVAGAIEDVTVEEAKRQFETNYFGTVRILRHVLPGMRAQRSGRIVVIGSIGGMIGMPYIGHYSASKFALDGLVQALRLETAQIGIQAAIVHPGDIRTQISANQIEGENTGSGSAYHSAFRRTVDIYDKNVREAREPDAIARVVKRVLERRRMPARIVAGTTIENAGVGLKATLPSRWFEAILQSSYQS